MPVDKEQWKIMWDDIKQIEKYAWYLPERKRRPMLQHIFRIKELIQSVIGEME